jgi:ATP-dependent RNA helicase DeaD
VNDEQIDKYFTGVSRKLGWLTGEDLLKRILSLEFNRLLEYYKNAPVIEVVEDKKPQKEKKEKVDNKPRTDKEKDRRTAEKGMARVYINLGKADGFYAGNLIEIINKNVSGARVEVGRIDLLSGYSLFDVKKGDAKRVVASLKGCDFLGKRIFIEIADPERDYARASARRNRKVAAGDGDDSANDGNLDQFRRKGRSGKKNSRRKK